MNARNQLTVVSVCFLLISAIYPGLEPTHFHYFPLRFFPVRLVVNLTNLHADGFDFKSKSRKLNILWVVKDQDKKAEHLPHICLLWGREMFKFAPNCQSRKCIYLFMNITHKCMFPIVFSRNSCRILRGLTSSGKSRLCGNRKWSMSTWNRTFPSENSIISCNYYMCYFFMVPELHSIFLKLDKTRNGPSIYFKSL